MAVQRRPEATAVAEVVASQAALTLKKKEVSSSLNPIMINWHQRGHWLVCSKMTAASRALANKPAIAVETKADGLHSCWQLF